MSGTPVLDANPSRLSWRSLLCAVAATIAGLLVAAAFGPLGVGLADVAKTVVNELPFIEVQTGLTATQTKILLDVRLPRVVLGGLVGAVLATSGGAYQATFHNPLADPYLLGAAGGAGLGVTIALTGTGGSLGDLGLPVALAAFIGGLAAVALTYLLGTGTGGRTGTTLILAGVAVAALCSSVQSLLLQRDDEALRDVYAWLLGRFNAAGWGDVRLLAPIAVVAIVVLVLSGRRLDLLALGDDEAHSLGVNATGLRVIVIVAATLATAAAVAVSGLIGFVGIIVPHAIRLRTGPGYRRILPLAAFYGAAFLALADLLARTLLAPAEVPIGVLTASVGAPFFLLLLRTSRVKGT